MSQAFGEPAFPVDTHIHRLAYRWGLSNGKNGADRARPEAPRFHVEEGTRSTFASSSSVESIARHPPDAEACPICSWAGVASRLKAEQKKRKKKG